MSIFFVLIISLILQACASSPAQSETKDDVVIAPIGQQQDQAGAQPVKRQQLEAAIMRYADRYSAFLGMESQRIMDKATTPEQRAFAIGLALHPRTAAVDIAIGPNAVENLLEMIVLVSLTRIEIENYWVPEVLGNELGESLVRTVKILDEDAWKRAATVLTSDQQQALREMIAEWKEQNPDQHFFWQIRFGEFSGQRASDLARVKQTGGLLGEVQQTRETVEEVQAFGERVMYYMLRAPSLTRLEAELGMRRMLASPEMVQLLDNAERLTQSTERYASMLEHLPNEREAAIKQMFQELNKEREAAINHMFVQTAQEREAAIKQLMEEQRETLKHVLASQEFLNTIDSISDEGDEIVNTTFLRVTILILIWMVAYVIAKLVYDRLVFRQSRSQKEGF
jgi:hypothetical protein